MQAISLVSQKGGSGKTTLALHLAVEGSRRGFHTLLMDLDPQASSARWADRRGDLQPDVTVLHGSRKRHSDPISFRRLCDTDRLRASKLQHAVQRKDRDANFSRSARIRARPKCVPDHPFVSTDFGFNQRTPVIAGRFLPGDTGRARQ